MNSYDFRGQWWIYFIIGNGFDLARGLKTSYEDFRAYLQEEYPAADADEFVMPDVYIFQ